MTRHTIHHIGQKCPHCKERQQVTRCYGESPCYRQHLTPTGEKCKGSLQEVTK
jgi:phage FluMu protein Com